MKKSLIIAIAGGSIALGGGLFTGIYGYNLLHEEVVTKTSNLYITKETTYDNIAKQIHRSIKSDEIFDFYADFVDLPETFHKGHYVIKKGMNIVDIVEMLQQGQQTPVRVTMNNAKIPGQLAKKLEGQIDADSTEIISVIGSDEVAKSYGFNNALEMYSIFIPNTYEMYWNISVDAFLKKMYKEYERFWTKERDEKRNRSNLSRLEVMTLASIVNEETRQSDEMPRVAGVYINRLRKGMPLQADPTIKYALQNFGLRRILKEHLKYKSPYNTYLNKGLPPTPICMPSISAIDAVLNYEEHNYLYFCARETFDGYHNFASTYNQHRKNARRYHNALNKRGIK